MIMKIKRKKGGKGKKEKGAPDHDFTLPSNLHRRKNEIQYKKKRGKKTKKGGTHPTHPHAGKLREEKNGVFCGRERWKCAGGGALSRVIK